MLEEGETRPLVLHHTHPTQYLDSMPKDIILQKRNRAQKGRKKQKWSKWDVKEAKKKKEQEKKSKGSCVCWLMPVISALGSLRSDYRVGPSLNKKCAEPGGDFRK